MPEVVFDKTVRDTLVSTSDDWLWLGGVVGIARHWLTVYRSTEPVRDVVVRVVQDLFQRGLVEIGDLDTAGGFSRWDWSEARVMEAAAGEWWADGEALSAEGERVWLSATDDGLRLGEYLIPEFNADVLRDPPR